VGEDELNLSAICTGYLISIAKGL